jgi:hypothetical protein
MGFDLTGRNPKDERGEYFRNNAWWWRMLSYYVRLKCKSSMTKAEYNGYWDSNDGQVISKRSSERIGKKLFALINSGDTEKFRKEYYDTINALPMVECNICKGKGKRNDKIVKGKCNGCDGKGVVKDWDTNYYFDVKNVNNFAIFSINSGGFEIW